MEMCGFGYSDQYLFDLPDPMAGIFMAWCFMNEMAQQKIYYFEFFNKIERGMNYWIGKRRPTIHIGHCNKQKLYHFHITFEYVCMSITNFKEKNISLNVE